MDDIRMQSGFDAAVLIDMEGKMLAEVHSPETQPITVDTLVQVANQVTARAENKSGIEANGESEFFDWDGGGSCAAGSKRAGQGCWCCWFPKENPTSGRPTGWSKNFNISSAPEY